MFILIVMHNNVIVSLKVELKNIGSLVPRKVRYGMHNLSVFIVSNRNG